MTVSDRELKVIKKPHQTLSQKLGNRTKINIYKLKLRLYRLSGGQIVNFLHIPKTGGSAVKSALTNVAETEGYKIHLRGHSCRLPNIPIGDKFFFFLRDPLQRFVSAFNHKKSGRAQWNHIKIQEETAALAYFHTADHLASALYSPELAIRQRAQEAMNCIEHVNTFYTDWFVSKEYFLSRLPDALYIGFQGSLTTDFENLKQILGLPKEASLPPLNSAEANKNPQQLESALTPLAEDNLLQWYAKDYDFLALCQEKADVVNQRALDSVA